MTDRTTSAPGSRVRQLKSSTAFSFASTHGAREFSPIHDDRARRVAPVAVECSRSRTQRSGVLPNLLACRVFHRVHDRVVVDTRLARLLPRFKMGWPAAHDFAVRQWNRCKLLKRLGFHVKMLARASIGMWLSLASPVGGAG